METDIHISVPELIARNVSKDRIAALLRDIWQLQHDANILSIAHDVLINPAIDLTSRLQEVDINIRNFRTTWHRYVRMFELPETYIRTYRMMESIFEMNLDDMDGLYYQEARFPFFINMQGKYIASLYNYNRSLLIVNLDTLTAEEIRRRYERIRMDFDTRINQFKTIRNSNINAFDELYKQLLMALDELFDETLADEDEELIINRYLL